MELAVAHNPRRSHPASNAPRKRVAAVCRTPVVMADVHGRRLLTVFGVIVLAKGVDLWATGGGVLAYAWVLTGVAVIVGYRWAPAAVTVLAVAAFAVGFRNQHMWLFMFLPLTFYAPTPDREWLWRWQVTIVYTFAAVTKLTPDYLSGRVLDQRLSLPAAALVGLSVAGLLTEGFLAFGLWRWQWTKLVGVAFHMSIVVVMATSLMHGLRLAVFSGLVVLLYSAFRVDTSGHTRTRPLTVRHLTRTG